MISTGKGMAEDKELLIRMKGQLDRPAMDFVLRKVEEHLRLGAATVSLDFALSDEALYDAGELLVQSIPVLARKAKFEFRLMSLPEELAIQLSLAGLPVAERAVVLELGTDAS